MGVETIIEIMSSMINDNKTAEKAVIIAKVKTPPPNLSLEFGGVTIPSELLYCANYLLPNYRRDYKLEGTIDQMHQEVSNYKFGNTTQNEIANGPAPHTHQIIDLEGSGTIDNTGDYETHGEFWFTDTLVEGVEVLCIKAGEMYVVTARIVKMPNEAIQGGA